jgi:hypothetical protein
MLGDLKSRSAILLKGWLFLLLGMLAAALLLLRAPSLANAALLGLCVWSFCRWYYCAFYVIEHYVDPGFRFAGILDFLRYQWRGTGSAARGSVEPPAADRAAAVRDV